ncbi:hypothetical protein [Agromyces sp. LHK192]|uniref:hypothetical protein n=1 Tax=Agromyces sp. LHK192 TaxID=2498704 RepID=UPI0013E297EF|nr:hypothetical protein [Agromyces sp. LHK192]
MRTDRLGRLARGASIAAFATLVAALAHTIGGGAPPGGLTLALALAFAVPFAAVVVGAPAKASTRAGGIRAAIAAVGAQLALHALYSLGTGAPVSGVVIGADATAVHHAHGAVALPELVAGASGVGAVLGAGHHGGWMLASHVGAAVLTIAFIVVADRGLAMLATLAGGIRRAVLLLVPVTAPAAGGTSRAVAPEPGAVRDPHLRAFRLRGPPVGVPAVA